MGKLEKIVVLSVLFLISVIVVLSLSTGTIEDDAPTAGLLEAPGAIDGAGFNDFGAGPAGSADARVAQLPVDHSPETSTPLERPGSGAPASVAPSTAFNTKVTLLSPGEAPRSQGGKIQRVEDRRSL